MTKHREILRLSSMGLSQAAVAASCGVSKKSVSKTLKAAREKGISWPLDKSYTDEALDRLLFPKAALPASPRKMPDFAYIRRELQRNGVNKKLLWTEYLEECRLSGETPLMYSQFCYYIQQDEQKRRATMHIDRKPGEQVEVDWAGDPAYITDPDTGEETEEEYDYCILNISLTNHGLEDVAKQYLSDEQYRLYQSLCATKGNRKELFDEEGITASPGGGAGGAQYDIPPEALLDERFVRMITEAEKYLGYPYVWGGASPATSFDCSGFVSWVINNSGNGWNYGRRTAEGLRQLCSPVRAEDAKPGDLIFFQGTYAASGASHVGIYVGNGMMIHCGDPIQYASVNTQYWMNHFYGCRKRRKKTRGRYSAREEAIY